MSIKKEIIDKYSARNLKTTMKKFIYEIKIMVEPDDSGYFAYCPGLKGVLAGGDTKKEAFENAKNTAIDILRTRLNFGDEIKEGLDLKRINLIKKE